MTSKFCTFPDCNCSAGAAERCEHPVLSVGTKVYKVGGRYGGPGRVVGMTEKLDTDGYRLYAVAMKVEGGYGEFIHVFPESVLSPTQDKKGDV